MEASPVGACALTVSTEEDGEKLVTFLHRRLGAGQAEMHRWIRTGQVRCNKGRAKPFQRLQVGDVVRVPPFALAGIGQEQASIQGAIQAQEAQPLLLPIIYEDSDFLVINKPAGLAVQPGTGLDDSVVARLRKHFVQALFMPAPAHRLDRHCSGLVLVGKSHQALRALHQAFSAHDSDTLIKEYLLWVDGLWPHAQHKQLQDWLAPEHHGSQERMACVPAHHAQAQEALCHAQCLAQKNGESLMLVRLITGRKHQIRVQFSSRGFPIVGDGKYGYKGRKKLMLHCWRIVWQGREFVAPPPWPRGPGPLGTPAGGLVAPQTPPIGLGQAFGGEGY